MGFAIKCLIVALSLGTALWAQTSTSSISGTVTDSSGAVVPGALVKIVNEETGVTYTQTTTGAGFYSIAALPVGVYTVSVEMRGFKSVRKSGNELTVASPITVDFRLEIGETTEVITVSTTAEALQTSDATVGNVVSQAEVSELPLNGRNPLALLTLEPGVVQRSAGAAGTGIHVNGSRDMSSNTTIDGIEANESSVPNASNNVHRLTPSGIQEYKVTTSTSTAEMGRNSGALVSIATRQGTNKFRGALYEYFRNSALNSNEFFANALGTPKPDIKLNQYGVEFGGPIRRNRTFFFVNWQDQKVNYAQPVDQVYSGIPLVYTPEALSGIYRYFVANPNTPFALAGQPISRNTPLLVDPRTGALREGVRYCASPTDANCIAVYNMFANDPRRIGPDPVIMKMFREMPSPNIYTVGDGLNTAGYMWNPPVRRRGASVTTRVDHNFDSNNSLFVRYIRGKSDTVDGDPNNSRPRIYPNFPPLGEVFRSNHNGAIGYRRVISPRVFNELTLGVSRFSFTFTQGEANPAFPDVPAFCRAQGTGFNNVDAPCRNVPRTFRAVTTPQVLNNLSVVTGSHVIKTGFNFRFYRHNDQRGQPGGATVTPLLTFDRSLRAAPGFTLPTTASATRIGINATDSNRLQGTINDIMGIPARLSQTFLGDFTHDTFLPFRSGKSVTLWALGHRIKQYNFYLQDEWKLRPNLTVNAGARWEINPAPTEAAGRVYVPDRPIDGSQGPVTFVKAKRWYQRNNVGAIGPRLSLAWSPNRRTVIRTGYSMAFDTIASFQVTATAGRVPGLTVTCESRVNGAVTPGCAAVPDLRIAEGFPQELPIPSLKPSDFLTPRPTLLVNAPNMTLFEQYLKTPTVHQWNFTIQRELPGSFIGQIAYVARRGTRLFRAYDLNQVNSDPILPSFLAMQRNYNAGCRADGTNCPPGVRGETVPIVASGLVTASFVNSTSTANELNLNAAGSFAGRVESQTLAARLRPNQQFATITYIDSGGDSYYHSLQATMRKRFSSGVLFGLAYTFGKSIDNQSVDPIAASSGGGLSTTNSRTPTDIRNWRLERGRSDYDRTHVLTSSWIYDLPFGRRKRWGRDMPRVLDAIAGGWSVNGIALVMSGEPFSVRSGVRTANYSHESRAILTGPKPPVKLSDKPGVIGPVYFANENVFALPAPGEIGMGRNIFTAPGFWNVDLGITKLFRIRENWNIQLRGEFFNAFNHPNFDNPRDASSGSTSFRSTLFGTTCCATVAPASARAIVDTGESGRVIQFALRMRF